MANSQFQNIPTSTRGKMVKIVRKYAKWFNLCQIIRKMLKYAKMCGKHQIAHVTLGCEANCPWGVEGLVWKIPLSWERCWRPHQKMLFLTRVMIFWKSRFACNYTMHKNLKSRLLTEYKRYIPLDSIHGRNMKFGLNLPQIWLTDFENFALWQFYGQNMAKTGGHIGFLAVFCIF